MSNSLLNRISQTKNYNEVLLSLRKRMVEADNEEDFKTSTAIAQQVKGLTIGFTHLMEVDPINIVFYLNYNEKMAIRGLKERSAADKLKLLKKIKTIDLSKNENKRELVDFIAWSICGMYDDKNMSQIVKFLCDNLTIYDSSKLFELDSYVSTSMYDRCKQIIIDTKERIYNEKQKTHVKKV